jgi:predicted transcriptional regulator
MSDNAARTALTARIVKAFVTSNAIPQSELGPLIGAVHKALHQAGEPRTDVEAVEKMHRKTAAQIRKSITPDALISFIDGRSYKTLKRHLAKNGLTIADYKAKFGLPADYPATAAAYSEQRANIARSLGLGKKTAPTPIAKVATKLEAEARGPTRRRKTP